MTREDAVTQRQKQLEHYSHTASVAEAGITNLRLLATTRLRNDLAEHGFSSDQISKIIQLLGQPKSNDAVEPPIYEVRRILAEKVTQENLNTSPIVDEVMVADEKLRQINTIDQSQQDKDKIERMASTKAPLEESISKLGKLRPEEVEILTQLLTVDRVNTTPSSLLGRSDMGNVPSISSFFDGGTKLDDLIALAQQVRKKQTSSGLVDQFRHTLADTTEK